uniref:Uncharacterized protein n=1 Tax=Molossus molossus TaxID=27622 RepID=A0A7J8EF55_MOLMO|nr:hypothetical protein HJG59_008950 [Molossus molossus]
MGPGGSACALGTRALDRMPGAALPASAQAGPQLEKPPEEGSLGGDEAPSPLPPHPELQAQQSRGNRRAELLCCPPPEGFERVGAAISLPLTEAPSRAHRMCLEQETLTRVNSDTLCKWRERSWETAAPAEPQIRSPVAVFQRAALSSELQDAFSIHIRTFDPQTPSVF